MIVNPGNNAYPMSLDEVSRFVEGLGRVYNKPEITCLIRYGLSRYTRGTSDIDLLCLTKRTVTDKQVLSEMGRETGELYQSFGKKYLHGRLFGRRLPKGVEMDLSVYDLPAFKEGLTTFNPCFTEVFEKSTALVGEYPKGTEIPSYGRKEVVHVSRNLSHLREFPLLRDVILRFKGKRELADVKLANLIKILDFPFFVFSHMNHQKPESRKEAIEYTETVFTDISHEPLKALLEAKKSFSEKMGFLNSAESDELLLDGTTWYEEIIASIFLPNYSSN